MKVEGVAKRYSTNRQATNERSTKRNAHRSTTDQGREKRILHVIDDDEARTYAKRKFSDLQAVRGERGRGTFKRKFARRQKKF